MSELLYPILGTLLITVALFLTISSRKKQRKIKKKWVRPEKKN